MKRLLPLLLLIAHPMLATSLHAFEITGRKWPGGKTDFSINLSGTAPSGIGWNSAFTSAIAEWNSRTPFQFTVIPESQNPCTNDRINAVDFAADLCGGEFGKNVLAVTLNSYSTEILGAPSIYESDIVVNSGENFNIFDGNLGRPGLPGLDLQRIALHELGHAIGLDHSASVNAIMRPTISNLFHLQADDILAVETLYGGLARCAVREFRFGLINDALDESDCTVEQLTASVGDDSYIDLYRLDVATRSTFNFAMNSSGLDSVLLVANANLQVIGYDDKPRSAPDRSCNSSLTITLSPGSYYLLANTFDEPLDATCTTAGSYQLSTTFSSASFLTFAATESFSGGPGFGQFSAGITANNGLSYSNRFRSTDSLDINATVAIDAGHQGQPGFLVVAALIGNEILMLNAEGEFVAYANNGVFERAISKTLGSLEQVLIASDLVPASLGITSIVVDFVVGYGLDSNPGELYFHSTPLNLTVTP